MVLTQRCAARSRAGVGDLLAVGIHTPALPYAAMTLCRFVSPVLITLWHVLTHGRPRAEEGEDAGAGGGDLSTLPVTLTLGLLALWEHREKTDLDAQKCLKMQTLWYGKARSLISCHFYVFVSIHS